MQRIHIRVMRPVGLLCACLLLWSCNGAKEDTADAGGGRLSQTLVAQGDGWMLLSVDAASAGQKVVGEPIYVVKGTRALGEIPLPDSLRQIVSEERGGAADDDLRIINERVIEAIRRSEETGRLDPFLASIAEPDDSPGAAPEPPASPAPDLAALKIKFKKCSNQEKVLTSQLASLKGSVGVDKEFKAKVKGEGGDVDIESHLLVGAEVEGDAKVQARFTLERVNILGACIPYWAHLNDATLFASIEASAGLKADASVTGTAEADSPTWTLAEIPLVKIVIFVGPIPILIGVDSPIQAGLHLESERKSSISLDSTVSAQAIFNYKCTSSGCSSQSTINRDNSLRPELTGDTEARFKPEAWAGVGLRTYVYDPRIFSATGSVELALAGDLWSYNGNNCGDADDNGESELVNALTFDLDLNARLRKEITFLNHDYDLSDKDKLLLQKHLYFKDLIGSTALDPMFFGPEHRQVNEGGMYQLEMRPCWPYEDSVYYTLLWGDGTTIFPLAPAHSWDLEQHAWAQPMCPAGLQLTAVRDAHGRELNRTVTRDVSVGACGPVCGNGVCESGETSASCPGDCGSVCGDGVCNGSETSASCPGDCGSVCGDGVCNGSETSASCPGDCGSVCGDGVCNGSETSASCLGDCGSVCGDGVCNGSETFLSCPGDCGGPHCGDGVCNGSETSASCPGDCGGSYCGDGICNSNETSSSCAVDCGFCGDGVCNGHESPSTCSVDCGCISTICQ
jgi:hypothetical protein